MCMCIYDFLFFRTWKLLAGFKWRHAVILLTPSYSGGCLPDVEAGGHVGTFYDNSC